MNIDPTNHTFDPQTLAADLGEVRRIYAQFFAGVNLADWDKPVKGKPEDWTLHETIAHLCALSGDGLESIEHALRGETYVFAGLENRYQFKDFNRHGIDAHLSLPINELCAEFLSILDRAIAITHSLSPSQAEISSLMPIYNRPVKIIEALGIIMFHAGLHHSAQVADPAGVPPLWQQLSPEIMHRVAGRVMRALSLLYRYDLGGELHVAITFQISGEAGGSWHVDVSPSTTASSEGISALPGLTLILREPAVFCRMFTGRFNPIVSILKGDLRLKGDYLLFLRFGSLFSVHAKN